MTQWMDLNFVEKLFEGLSVKLPVEEYKSVDELQFVEQQFATDVQTVELLTNLPAEEMTSDVSTVEEFPAELSTAAEVTYSPTGGQFVNLMNDLVMSEKAANEGVIAVENQMAIYLKSEVQMMLYSSVLLALKAGVLTSLYRTH